MQPPYTAIKRIGAALDEAVLHQPIHHSTCRNAFDFKRVRELGLCEAVAARETYQRPPLLPGHAEIPRPHVKYMAYVPCNVVHEKADCKRITCNHCYNIAGIQISATQKTKLVHSSVPRKNHQRACAGKLIGRMYGNG